VARFADAVKYAEPSVYEIETRKSSSKFARELMGGSPIAKAPLVDLLEDDSLEIELATTCCTSIRTILTARSAKESPAKRRAVNDSLTSALNTAAVTTTLARLLSCQRLKFDILMDVGASATCTPSPLRSDLPGIFTAAHGFDAPRILVSAAWARATRRS